MAEEYVYQPVIASRDYEADVAALSRRIPNPIRRGWVEHERPETVERVCAALDASGLPPREFPISPSGLRGYLERARYRENYPDYYRDNLAEKSLEHFLCVELLDLSPGDVFLDIASEGSPLPEIAARIFGCQALAQDIMYPPGIQGNRVGGDACRMPLPGGSVTKAALTCSLEHFEGDADVRLFAELARVLKPQGRVLVVPLYLFPDPAAMTDPTYSAAVTVPFDSDAEVWCANGWNNRHGRFYNPETLRRRILAHEEFFRFTIYRLTGYDAIPGNIYARFALLAERR